MTSSPPTSMIGYTSDEVYMRQILGAVDELVPAVMWPESNATYSQMRRDPQLAGILSAITLPLRRAKPHVDPAGCRPQVAQMVADDLGIRILGDDEPRAARVRGVSWQEHTRAALLHLIYGHYGFELGATLTERDTVARLTSLAERVPHTIAEMKVNRNGELTGIVQDGVIGDQKEEPPTIDASRLLWYCHDREGAAWQGQSLLRPAYGPWVLKREMMRVHATGNRRFGMGVPTVEWAVGTNPTPAQQLEAATIAERARVGEVAGAAFPPGARLNLVGLSGGVPDTLKFIQWLDQQMSRMVLAGFLDLGETANGSRALGESFLDLFMLSLQAIGDYMGETLTRQVAARIVEWNFDLDEPVPTVRIGDVRASHEVTAETITALIASGAITPDDELEAYLRNLWDLPRRTTPRPPAPTPAVTAPPVAAGRRRQLLIAAAANQQTPGREPTEQETAAGVDFALIAAAYAAAVAALLALLPSLTAGLIAWLADSASAVATSGDLSGLADLAVPAEDVAGLADAITEVMNQLSAEAAEQAVAEAAHQGVDIDPPDPAAWTDRNAQVADVMARVLADGYTTAATKTALLNSGDPEAVRDAIVSDLEAMTDTDGGWLADNVKAAMTSAETLGRAAVLAAAPDGTLFVASEILDSATCKPCRDIDTTVYTTWQAALEDYPVLGFRDCLGRSRCRGMLFAVHDVSS